MKCFATFSENNLYKLKLVKTRKNVLEGMYQKPCIVEPSPPIKENMRLRFRFTEAIKEAQDICEMDNYSSECHWAWYEVDELEDSILRLYPDRL